MVDFGHDAVVELGYSNPDRPRLAVEAMTFAQLRARTRRQIAVAAIRPDFHQLTVIRGGEATASVDFVDYPCGPGTVLHVRPGQVQRLPAGPDGGPADLDATVVLFTADFPPRLSARVDLEFGVATRIAPEPERHELVRAAVDLAAEYQLSALRYGDSAALTVELLRHQLAALLLRIARLAQPDTAETATGSAVFRAFRREAEARFAHSRDVATYAARLGYSPRTLTRACLAATGLSAKQFLDARVALEAKRLLAHSDLTVATIGRAVGFSEPTNFGKFFARETGCTPGAFRAREQ